MTEQSQQDAVVVASRGEAADTPEQPERPAETADLVVEELLVEDVSIDGMCGVY
jgi:mycofactocin precursor